MMLKTRSFFRAPSFSVLSTLGLFSLVLAGCQDAGGEGRGAEALASGEKTSVSRPVQEEIACDLTEMARSAPEANLSIFKALDVDSKGQIYVADWPSKYVRVLSPNGDLLRTIGRSGKGPGEFAYVSNVQILPGDSLLVYDQNLGRITVFTPHSEEVAYTTNLVTADLPPPDFAEKTSQGSIVAWYVRGFSLRDDPAMDNQRKVVVRLLGTDGSVLRDSVLVVPSSEALVARSNGGFTLDGSPPFGRDFVIDLGPENRIYYGSTDSLKIGIFTLQGQRVGGFSTPYEPPPVTDQDVEDAFAAKSESWREEFRRVFEESVPETWPAFENFVVDDQGRLWIGLLTPTGEPTQWVAFNESGTRICSATLPENVELKLIRAGKAYGVATDELDVPRVVVYEIGEQGAGEIAS